VIADEANWVDPLLQRVADNVRDIATAKGIALTHLPDRAGVARSYFWDVLGLRRNPTLKWLGKIADALDVDPAELVAKRASAPAGPKSRQRRRR
jgi:transcriptional regulator with XRE-family HTH domain